MWEEYNPNPAGRRVGDCTVRAICRATGESWGKVYAALCAKGYELGDMPSSNSVWGAYLRDMGFHREIVPESCPECYTVRDFCEEHRDGTYILALSGHVVCVENGRYFDTWDSGTLTPLYYWKKGE